MIAGKQTQKGSFTYAVWGFNGMFEFHFYQSQNPVFDSAQSTKLYAGSSSALTTERQFGLFSAAEPPVGGFYLYLVADPKNSLRDIKENNVAKLTMPLANWPANYSISDAYWTYEKLMMNRLQQHATGKNDADWMYPG